MSEELGKRSLSFLDDHYCFCCGEKNPIGLKIKFKFEGERLLSDVFIPKELQGFANVVHGGVLGALLDELMVNLYWLKGLKVVTAEYQVRLKAPCPVDQKVFLSAWSLEKRKRLYMTAAQACLGNNTLVAEAQAKCMAFN